ncbi:hypothetical protein CLF_113607, partial [Clonorchis sinensis]
MIYTGDLFKQAKLQGHQELTTVNTSPNAIGYRELRKKVNIIRRLLCRPVSEHTSFPGRAEDSPLERASKAEIPPTKQAQSLLGSVLSKPDHESLHADWLRKNGSKRTLGLLVTLSSPSAVQKILGRIVSTQKAYPTIRRLSEDRSLEARKIDHCSSREEVQKRLPDGASSADPKLKAKPTMGIASCAPTATPDSSFYSTTGEPLTFTGSDALNEVSLTWTERPKYVGLSALLSVRDGNGAAVNSTPKSQLLSWTGSDKRSQVAKPTGKPTTCADVDIGECCENRASTEAVKVPISSSTPSKVASLIVDTTVAQDHDNQ